MIFLAFVLSMWLAIIRAKKVGIAGNVVMDLTIWLLISGLAGARATYVLFHLNEFSGHWIDVISPIQSDGTIGIAGLVVLGGVLAGIPAAWFFLRRRGIPFLKMIDILAPSLALGIAIGRIGCFLNGCCFGNPTDLSWGVIFPATCYAGSVYPNTAIHPTQLYSTMSNLVIVIILLIRTPYRKFIGELSFLFLVLYGLFRFLIETMRYYRPSMIFTDFGDFHLTISMVISVAMCITGIILLAGGNAALKGRRGAR